MPRVLIVTYPWLPAYNAGVRHAATLARYLPEAGWDPIILCRDWSDGALPADDRLHVEFEGAGEPPALRAARAIPSVPVPFAARDNRPMRWHAALVASAAAAPPGRARKLARAALDASYPLYGAYPDTLRGWVGPAVRAGIAAIRQFGVGAVISMSAPDSAHIAGGVIARGAGVPWVPLFGELGSFRLGRADGRTVWQRFEHRELARRWLRGAFGAGAISPEMTDYLERTFGLAAETLAVPFDPEERRLPPRRIVVAPLRVVHVGRIATAARLVPVLDALGTLMVDDPALSAALQVELVGSGCEDEVRALVASHPAGAAVRVLPRVPPTEAIRLQREADVLLLFGHDDPLARYPSVFTEQLNARRPIVAVAGEESFVARVLRVTRAGEAASDAAGVARLLSSAMEKLRAAGEVPYHGEDAAIARYGGPEQARAVAGMLDVASAGRFGRWQRS